MDALNAPLVPTAHSMRPRHCVWLCHASRKRGRVRPMPKRSGSNKLQRSKRSGPRRTKSPSPQSHPTPSSSASSPRAPREETARRAEPRRPVAARSSEPTPEPATAAATPAPSGWLAKFNELPSTTRYAIIGAAVALVIGLAYFASQSRSATPAPTTAPPASQLAPTPIALPSAMLPGSGTQPLTIPSAPAQPPSAAVAPSSSTKAKLEPPKTPPANTQPPKAVDLKPAPPKPAAPPPAAPAPVAPKSGGDNPY